MDEASGRGICESPHRFFRFRANHIVLANAWGSSRTERHCPRLWSQCLRGLIGALPVHDVDADFNGIGKAGTKLDEQRTEVLVRQVKVAMLG